MAETDILPFEEYIKTIPNLDPNSLPIDIDLGSFPSGADELGRPVYKTRSGASVSFSYRSPKTSSLTRAAGQAVADYLKNPSLPSTDQVKDAVVGTAKAAYEPFEKMSRGTGTIGDLSAVVGTVATPAWATPSKEGALHIFGGKKATSPGYTRSGKEAPESVGADTKYRFEIDDSQMVVVPSNVKQASGKAQLASSSLSELGDSLIHEDLFFQYPELKKVKFFADTDLSGTNTGGYYSPDYDAIAVNPSLLSVGSEEQLKKTLLHEIQHKVQDKEGFTQGDNPNSPEVMAQAIKDIDSPENIKAWEDYESEIKTFENKESLFVPLTKARDFITEYATANNIRLSSPSALEKIKDKFSAPRKNLILEENLKFRLGRLNNLLENLEDPSVDFNYTLGEIDSLYKTLVSVTSGDEKAKKLFRKVVGFDSDAMAGPKAGSNSPSDFFVNPPDLPELPSPKTTPVDNYVLESVYRRKQGEVEATNAADRLKLTLEERFKRAPESTERTLRPKQWFAEGGAVLTMDEQMNKLYAEGGVNTTGQTTDPVSGNEIPPGSLPEEVRDDIDAKLSGGEYIVPADVLRYYGVAFFEKLRNKAKEGLGGMEAEGRIGGDTVEEEDDDLPFDAEELQSEDEGEPAFAQGGLTEEKTMLAAQPTFNPSQWAFGGTGGSTTSAPTAAPIKETKVYSDAVGNTVSVEFINGVAQTPIPAGYSLKTTQTPAPNKRKSSRNNAPVTPETSSGVGGTTSWAKDLDLSNPKTTMDWAQEQLSGNKVAKAGLGIAGALLGGGLGAGVGSVMGSGIGVSNVRAAAQVARHDGDEGLATQLDALVGQQTKDIKKGTKAYINIFATGDKKAEALIESRGKQGSTTIPSKSTPKPTGIVSRPSTPSKSYGTPIAKRGVTSTAQNVTKEGGYSSSVAKGSTAPTSSPRPKARPTATTNKYDYTYKAGGFGGGRATGGLVEKRKS